MRWKASKQVLAVVAVIVALATADVAASRARAGTRGALFARATERLDLNAEQRQQLRALFEEKRGEVRRQLDALRETRNAQSAAVRVQPFDEERIRNAAAAVGAAQADLAVTRARIANDVRSMLTPEQRTRLEQMLDDYLALRGGVRSRLRDRRDRASG